MRHLRNLVDIGRDGLRTILDAADGFKDHRDDPNVDRPLAGKSVALVFEKASTRTRVSLEVAVAELGGHPLVLTSSGSQMARGEPLADTARVLSRMVHAITFRTSGHERLLELIANSTVPVLNALTDASHPMQLLADLQTVRRMFGRLDALNYAWIGDGNNMAHSWIEAAGLLGLRLVLACPKGYEPDQEIIDRAAEQGGSIELVRDPRDAARGADVISTDVFASMGKEQEHAQRLEAFRGMCVTRQVTALAAPRHIVMHCLPAHRGEEIEDAVIEGPHSAVWDQAEARLHTAKAALVWALGHDA
jgi:ornithine carbamoyltransferase